MVKMIPSKIPDLLVHDRKRGAERAVYEALRDGLSPGFVVYWSRPWHRFRPDGGGQDGEVDFVVGHPEFGFLCIEVKGGVVAMDDQGTWTSTSRTGTVYELNRSPVQQAMTGKHVLLRALRDLRALRNRFINATHGVVLPDSGRPKNGFGIDAPLDIFAFGNDMSPENLANWVQNVMERGATTENKFGADGMQALHELVAANFELRPHLAQSLAQDMRNIQLLTNEQAFLLEALEGNPQMAIAGTAGTGKTLLAMEKAMRCAQSGQRTLLTCFNTPLAVYLRDLVGDVENLTIAGFHELCGKMANAASISVPKGASTELYNETLPSALADAMQAKQELMFDAIIVDEGQDFRSNWYDALRLSLKDIEAGCLHFFYDDNQRIYGSDQSLLDELPKSTFRLNRNLRNTKSIHRALTHWYGSQAVIAAGPNGEPVDWTVVKSKGAAYTSASAFVKDLVEKNQVAVEDIAILTGTAREKCGLFQQASIGGAKPIKATDPRTKDSIICDTIRRFKGLEKKCVVLIDIDQIHDDELIYVGLSRPSVLLKVIGSAEDISRLKGE